MEKSACGRRSNYVQFIVLTYLVVQSQSHPGTPLTASDLQWKSDICAHFAYRLSFDRLLVFHFSPPKFIRKLFKCFGSYARVAVDTGADIIADLRSSIRHCFLVRRGNYDEELYLWRIVSCSSVAVTDVTPKNTELFLTTELRTIYLRARGSVVVKWLRSRIRDPMK
jgi:hypothetical protein